MKMKALAIATGAATLIFGGCASTPSSAERGRDGTIAYYITVETSVPGIRIEADNNYIGRSPIQLKIFGDTDGTFHNWGSYEYTVRALPDTTKWMPKECLWAMLTRRAMQLPMRNIGSQSEL
jgi:hypothetical protein